MNTVSGLPVLANEPGGASLQLLDGNASELTAQEAEIQPRDEDGPFAERQSMRGEAAFSALVERQGRFVFRVAFAMLRNSEDAEDVVQETFMKLYRNGTWQDIREERGFLARTAWRVALDHISARRPHQVEEPGSSRGSESASDYELANLASGRAGPEQAIVEADWHATIHRLIDALPEELRQPLALSSLEEMTSREIAEMLGISEGTVRTRLMRARLLLKQKLTSLMEVRHAK